MLEIIPDKVNSVPPTSTVELAPKDIVPAKEEVPVDVLIVPPLTVNPSVVEYATPCKSKVAPDAIVVPDAFVPSALRAVTESVPADIVVAPL